MSIMQEFKEFAVKGNVLDMAVGIIIGAAFTPIVKSLVDDIVMPPIGYLIGGVDFTKLALELPAKAGSTEPVLIKYGNFINVTFTFVIIAFVVFMIVKGANKMKGPAPAAK